MSEGQLLSGTNIAIGEKLSEKELCPEELLRGHEEAFARDIERLRSRQNELVVVSCPACGSSDYRDELQKFGFEYVSCRLCRTLFMNPRPSAAVMSDYYADSENYRYWAQYIFPASEQARREKIHRPWLDRVVSYCSRYNVPQSLLMEVGPGFGTFSCLAQDSGQFNNVVAVEPTPELAAACRKRGVNVVEKRIEEVTDEAGVPDVIVSFEVIEHLFNPRDFVSQCARLLNRGGLLVLSCPNGLGFDVSMLRAESLAIDVEHVNLFNPSSLELLAKDCGFDVLEVTTPGRLDAEFVHDAILKGRFDVSGNPFLKLVLVDQWDRLGWAFQQFLAQNGLSSHMWMAARRV